MSHLFTICLLIIAISLSILCTTKIIEILISIKKEDRHNKFLNENLLLNSFIIQIQHPMLNDIFENDIHKKDMSKEAIATRRNFIIYILSVFDFAIDYYYGPKGYAKLDPALRKAWETTIFDYFNDSDELVEVYLTIKEEYNLRFQNYADRIIKKRGS